MNENFFFLNCGRRLGTKSQLIERSCSALIKTIRLNNIESNKRYLGLKLPLGRKRKDIMMGLLSRSGTIPPTLKYNTWGHNPLSKRKALLCIYCVLISAVRHSNIAFESMTLRVKMLAKKKISP